MSTLGGYELEGMDPAALTRHSLHVEISRQTSILLMDSKLVPWDGNPAMRAIQSSHYPEAFGCAILCTAFWPHLYQPTPNDNGFANNTTWLHAFSLHRRMGMMQALEDEGIGGDQRPAW